MFPIYFLFSARWNLSYHYQLMNLQYLLSCTLAIWFWYWLFIWSSLHLVGISHSFDKFQISLAHIKTKTSSEGPRCCVACPAWLHPLANGKIIFQYNLRKRTYLSALVIPSYKHSPHEIWHNNLNSPFIRSRGLSGTVSSFAKVDAPSVDLDQVISDPKQIQHQQQLSDTISIPVEVWICFLIVFYFYPVTLSLF